MNEHEIIPFILCSLLGWLVGFAMGGWAVYMDWRQWAIKKKLGEWQVNNVTGEKSFVWFGEKGAK